MSQVIIAPSDEIQLYPSVFLAGGITDCKDWQKDVIDELKNEKITIFNPRQEHFNVANKMSSIVQIFWEYKRLEQMDIFSMYFCNSNSAQPICLYELGRYVVRMQNRFPSDWEKRIIISVENGYKRKDDIIIQTGLCAPKLWIDTYGNPKTHANYIMRTLRGLT